MCNAQIPGSQWEKAFKCFFLVYVYQVFCNPFIVLRHLIYLNSDENWLKVESFFSVCFLSSGHHSFLCKINISSHFTLSECNWRNDPLKKRELSCITRTSTMTRSISLIKVEKCFNGFLLVTMNMKNEQKEKRNRNLCGRLKWIILCLHFSIVCTLDQD